ncbi:MAG: ATP-binding protein [Acidobacteriota bacterium]
MKVKTDYVKELSFVSEAIEELSGEKYKLLEAKEINKFLSSLIKLSNQIISSFDLDSFLKSACENVVKIFNLKMAWIGFLDEKTFEVKPVVSYGFERDYLKTIKIKYDDSEYSLTPTGMSIKTKKPVVQNNIISDLKYKLWREEALRRGYKSSAAIPLIFEEKVLGALNVYSVKSKFFTKEKISLLRIYANIISSYIYRVNIYNELKRYKEDLDTTLSSISECVFKISYDGKKFQPVFISPQIEKITGYPVKNFIENLENIVRIVHPEDRQKTFKEIVSIPEKERIFSKFRIINKKGDILWVDGEAFAEKIPDSNIIYIIGSLTDITKSTEEREKLYEELLQAQKMETLASLTIGIAHDLNNLIAIILGYSDLAKMHIPKENEKIYSMMETIQKSSIRASELVDRILGYGRKEKISITHFNVNDIINELMKLISRVFEKNIKIETDLAPDLDLIKADPKLIYQAILNLCINARDAMPDGGKLHIETTNVFLDKYFVESHLGAKTGDYILISVSDTGIGMDSETKKKIFQPFFTTKAKGSGLGLSVVWNIVKNLEGYITVYSEPGNGSMFNVYLPSITKRAPK